MYVTSLFCATKVADSMKVNAVESIWLDMKSGSDKRHTLRVGAFYRAGCFGNLLSSSFSRDNL